MPLINWFVFKDRSGACLHQRPTRKRKGTRGSPETADTVFIKMKDSLPCQVLCAKTPSSLTRCMRRVFTHTAERLRLVYTDNWPRHQMALYVFVLANKKVWGIEVVNRRPCLLYAAVHYLKDQCTGSH